MTLKTPASSADIVQASTHSSRKVVDIIAVIEGISFQTNILALNAAVSNTAIAATAMSQRVRERQSAVDQFKV